MIVVWLLTPDAARVHAAATLPAAQQLVATGSIDIFQFPLPTWQQHCLGFGSQWRYCNGTALRTCPTNGAVWLHTGVDIRTTPLQPVMAAGGGLIIGYTVDPVFHGGVLIRHQTGEGVVLTQYWRGALPPTQCDGFPAFPYRFVDPTAFITAHLPPSPRPAVRHCMSRRGQ
jgi:hypothetical protein